jgi:hypothetical protein
MKRTLLIVFVFGIGGLVRAQQTDSLFRDIARMDSILFHAFNNRDIEHFQSLFDESLEFYHDEGGLTGYAHTVDFMKETAKPGNDLKRELIKESLEVYPIPGYGAIEIGSHRFCHTEKGKADCGTFRFMHVWQQKNKQWKITRVISYGHVPPAHNYRKAVKLPLSTLDLYSGKYRGPQTGDIVVKSGQDHLILLIKDKEFLIYPETETLFFTKERDLTFDFENIKTINARIIVRENGQVAEEFTAIK